jgi:hypothetical protein
MDNPNDRPQTGAPEESGGVGRESPLPPPKSTKSPSAGARHGPSFPSGEGDSSGLEQSNASYTAMEMAGFEEHQEMEQEGYVSDTESYPVDTDEALPGYFAFKANDEDKRNKAGARASELLDSIKGKAGDAAQEADPLARLEEVRQSYLQQRQLAAEALKQTQPRVTAVRVLEVASGRAAAVGLVTAFLSEVFYGQSVLSQLLGRFEGAQQVEFAVPQARTAASLVLALAAIVTTLEVFLFRKSPPAMRWLGISKTMQLWSGRAAMAAFALIILYETMHSNRPVVPFFYLFGH